MLSRYIEVFISDPYIIHVSSSVTKQCDIFVINTFFVVDNSYLLVWYRLYYASKFRDISSYSNNRNSRISLDSFNSIKFLTA
jgi:hypothetical protein